MAIKYQVQKIVTALETLAGAFGGPGVIEIDLSEVLLGTTGAKLAVFADGASATPGTELTDSKAICIRWNNHATPTVVGCQVGIPRDFNAAVNATLKFNVSKTGATVGDATTITAALYNQVPGALHDADSNFGGATNAVTGNATSKTIATLSRTLALADLASYPSSMTVQFGPTAGTLGTDDFHVHRAWIEYTRKNPT